MKALLIGNYGDGNFGDEALKEYFVQTYPELQWVVLSAVPGRSEMARLPGGFRSFLSGSWIKTLRAFRSTDIVVFGGGTLFTDIESVRACFLWWIHAMAARFFGKPLFFCFQGVGPFQTSLGRWCTRSVLKKSVFLSVRDAESEMQVKSLNLSIKIVQTSDPLFSLFIDKKSDDRTKNVLVLIPRKNSSSSFTEAVDESIKSHSYSSIVILSFQPKDEKEQKYCRELQSKLKQATIKPVFTSQDVVGALTNAAVVVTQRYHGAIAAVAMGCKTVICPQATGDKLDAVRTALREPGFEERMVQRIRHGETAFRAALKAQALS